MSFPQIALINAEKKSAEICEIGERKETITNQKPTKQ